MIVVFFFGSSKQERVDQGIETEGSNLSGVSAKCVWDDLSQPPEDEEDSRSICIGSQPRRLSNKGTAPPSIEVKLFCLRCRYFRQIVFSVCLKQTRSKSERR